MNVHAQEGAIGWKVENCEIPSYDCVSVVGAPGQLPFLSGSVSQPQVSGTRLKLGVDAQQGSGISQDIELDTGRYVLSWYTSDGIGGPGVGSGRVLKEDGTELDYLVGNSATLPRAG